METVKRTPALVRHAKAPGASLERLQRALGSIPYRGPVVPLTLTEPPDPPQRPDERARD
jgi:hypothetical protein